MTTIMYQTIADGEIWHGKIQNPTKDGSIYWVYTIIARILNSEGKTHHDLAIRVDTTEGIPPLSPTFRFCSATDLRTASRDSSCHLGEPGERKASSRFESRRDSSLTMFVGKDYAA
jgi:hypothetical protein